MEILAAALTPLMLGIAIVRLASRDPDVRRASVLFALLAALWFAPASFLGRTPVSLDFLLDAPPLAAPQPGEYLQKNFLLNDVPLQMLPWREAAVRAWRSGALPFLDRQAASGTPLWENPQAAVLYPPNLLSIPFSTFAWPLFVATSKVMVALLGMYLLLRELSLGHIAAMFGAVAWGFGAFTITYLMFPHSSVTTLLPLLMFFLQRRASGRGAAAVWATITLFVMFTAGHPESLFHCALIAIPWCAMLVWRSRESRAGLARDYFLCGILALMLAAPLVVPFIAYLPHSQRLGDISAHQGFLATPSLGFDSLVTFVVPNYFGNPRVHNYRNAFNFNELCSQFAGLTTLVFAVTAVAANPRKYAAGVVLFVMVLLLSTQPEWLRGIVEQIPLFGVTAHSRLRFALAFLVAIAGAIGFDQFIRGERRGLFAAVAAAAFVLVSAVCVFSYPVFAQYGVRRLVMFTELAALAGCALIVLARFRPRVSHGRLFVALLFIDLFAVTGLYNPANGRELDYPATSPIRAMKSGPAPYRIAGIERALQPNQSVFHGLEDVRPHDPLAFLPYVGLLDRAGLNRSTYFERFESLPPKGLLDFLGVRYVIAPPSTTLSLPVAYAGSDAVVYRNDGARPRYFIPEAVRASADPARDLIEGTNGDAVAALRAPPVASGKVEIVSYESSRTTLNVVATGETLVASSEVALPGWYLERNGVPWPLETINGAFLGWRAPAASSTFVLYYRPVHFRASVALALVATLAIGGWLAWAKRRDFAAQSPA